MSAYARVDLPEPFGPMTAWTSFVSTARSTPLTISVPSSRATCRFLSSSSANFVRPRSKEKWRIPRPFVTYDSRPLRPALPGVHGGKTLLCSAHARLDRTLGARDPFGRRPPRLRPEAPSRDGQIARQGHARVQELDLGQRRRAAVSGRADGEGRGRA